MLRWLLCVEGSTFITLIVTSDTGLPGRGWVSSSWVASFLALPLLTQGSVSLIVVVSIFFHARFNHKTVASAPTILTTTGIFFTFLGIAFGLADFDTTNVQDSVPTLLNGLKTAFWASVFGVAEALSIKIRHFAFGIKDDQVHISRVPSSLSFFVILADR
jgi:hypothetical protein